MATRAWKYGIATVAGMLVGYVLATAADLDFVRCAANALNQIKAGEWLQAVATFFGVIATIAGTLLIENILRRREDRQRSNLLRETLQLLSSTCEAINAAQIAEPEDIDEFRTLMRKQFANLVNGQASLDLAKAAAPARTFDLWSSLNIIEEQFRQHRGMLVTEQRLVSGDASLAVVRIALSKAHGFQNSIRFAIADAIRELEAQS